MGKADSAVFDCDIYRGLVDADSVGARARVETDSVIAYSNIAVEDFYIRA